MMAWTRAMWDDVDVFDLWRTLLATVVAVYTLAYTVRTLWTWLAYFEGSPRLRVMGKYAMVLFLRARLRRFAAELWQIGGLLALLGGIVWLHWVLV